MTKVAFVVQRYGTDVVGGAEAYCRQLAEKLVSALKWDVDVYTTTSQDYTTWANVYSPGLTQINGVNVYRYHSLIQRHTLLFGPLHRLLTKFWAQQGLNRFLQHIQRILEWFWLRLQGPWSRALIQELIYNEKQYKKIFYITYLYYPTLKALPLLSAKSILIPTAHDEPPFYSQMVGRMLAKTPLILALTEAEQSLIQMRISREQNSISDSNAQKLNFLGYGLELPSFSAGMHTMAAGAPYLLYLGRLSHGKGVGQLIKWFTTGPESQGLRLILAGLQDQDFEVPQHPSVEFKGRVSDEEKKLLIAGARAVVNPSAYESLSMLVIEGMLAGIPALVNTTGEVLRFYTEQTKTVLGFTDQQTFYQSLERLQSHYQHGYADERWTAELTETQDWAKKRFSWDRVLKTIENAVNT